MSLLVKLLSDTAKPPLRATSGAAAYDLYASVSCSIPPNSGALVRTGIAISLPLGTCGVILPRSGLAVKQKIDVRADMIFPVEQVHPGLIDEDYREEVMVYVINRGDVPFAVLAGDRIAQMLVTVALELKVIVVSELPGTKRLGGFGSTGLRDVMPDFVPADVA